MIKSKNQQVPQYRKLKVSSEAEGLGRYRRPFRVAWTQLPLGKASGEWGLAHRTHAHG